MTSSGPSPVLENRMTVETPKNFRCIFCPYKCSTNQSLEAHLRSHIQEKPFFCKICGAEFTQESHLRKTHVLIHTGQKPFKCPECPKRFGQRTNLNIHFKLIHTDARPFSCEWCGKSFKLRGYLKVHIRTVHKLHKPHQCEFCGKGFSQKRVLDGHIISQHMTEKDRPYKCEYCDKSFIFPTQLTDHLRSHSGDKPYKCEFCGDAYTTSGSLRAHIKIHRKEILYKDAASGTAFELSYSRHGLKNPQATRTSPLKQFTLVENGAAITNILTSHRRPQPEFEGQDYVRGIKTESSLTVKCDQPGCNAIFTNHNSLACHMTKHLDKNTRCSFCGQIFMKEDDRVEHIAEFHDAAADPLQCKKCGKVTRDKKALWRHVRETHWKGPTPTCEYCGLTFKRRDSLNEHLKYKHPVAGQEKIFHCELCFKVYNSMTSLRHHIKTIHRGAAEGVFRCVLCNTTYEMRETYWRHMMWHANPKSYPCRVCRVSFRNISHFKRHLTSMRHKYQARKSKNRVTVVKEEPGEDGKVDIKLQDVKPLTKEELIDLCLRVPAQVSLHRVDQWTTRGGSKKRVVKSELLLKCTYCGDEDFPNVASVRAHEVICLMKIKCRKLHICPHCSREFNQGCKLRRHMESVHSEERGFQCSYCDSKFKLESVKTTHEKAVHFGIRWQPKQKYPCTFDPDKCQKMFSSSKCRRRHIEGVHLGIRHPCGSCWKSFKRLEQLQRHVKTEHSEKPMLLLCHPCKRAYKSRTALIFHFRTKRHQRKTQELCRQFGNKQEMTEVLSGSHKGDNAADSVEKSNDTVEVEGEPLLVKDEKLL